MRHSYDSALPSFKISCHVSLFTAFSLAVSVSSMPSSFSSFIAFPTQVAIGLPGGLLTVLGNSFKAGCAGASSGSLSRCPSQLSLLFLMILLQGHSTPNQSNFRQCPTWPTQKILKKIILHPLPEKLLYSDFQLNRSNTFRDTAYWKLKHFLVILKIAVLVNFAEPYLQKYLHYNAETYSP